MYEFDGAQVCLIVKDKKGERAAVSPAAASRCPATTARRASGDGDGWGLQSSERLTDHLTHRRVDERAQLRGTVCTSVGEGHKAAKTRIKEAKVSNVAKVVGVSKLKTKYEVRTR